jgi:hypothetical protein
MVDALKAGCARRARRALLGLCLVLPFPLLAGDLTGGVFLQIPLGSGEPFYGFHTGWHPPSVGSDFGGVDLHRPDEMAGGAVMQWRNHFDGRSELWMNGTRLAQTNALYANGGAAGDEAASGIDAYTVAAVVVGAVLVAAIVNADSVKGCVGTACPPPEPPPDPPDPDD